ncbi:MAG: IS1595 family transposase [Candidatus Binataceae bacterium]
MREKKPKEPLVPQLTLSQFAGMFPDEAACKAYLVARRWPQGVRCPRCQNEKVYELKTRPFHWVCKKCGKTPYRFSVTVGTIFENTNYKLLVWFKVLHLMVTSKKGISALQIHRMIGSGSYRTAWFMCHRLRAGMADPEFRQLMGIVEVDETYIGGKAQNMHLNKRKALALTGTKGKATVIGAISRKGNVVCKVIENTDQFTLDRFVRKAVNQERVDMIMSDEHGGYRLLGTGPQAMPHGVVRHSAGEYVHGIVHTNTIEGFWSLLKRGIMGSYHKVSKKYLPLYINEFVFRYNNRKNPDIFGSAIAGC